MENELRNMRREMDELRNAIKDRAMENLDRMIRRTDSPFTIEVLNHPLPPKFCLPQLESFDGSKDPLDHIESFKTLMLLQMTPDEVMYRAFPTTLKGTTRVWFGKLPSGTIANFYQLNKGFVCHFIGGERHKKPTKHLLNIHQAELEAKNLIVQADSQLVIGQVKGDYEAKEERMQKYLKIDKELQQHFDNVEFQQIPHAKNTEVDFLACLVSSYKHNMSPKLCMETRGQPNTEGERVIKIQVQDEWMTPIVRYLKEG